ncbi:MAG TPA: bacterial transcriptional activator domain-containing protein [Bacteroidota bacterium]
MAETPEQRIQTLEKHLSSQPRSPLFAQLAGYYLEAGRAQEALTLCDTGLAYYPFFATAHLIKGKTLLELNMRSEARREFEFVHQMLPHNEAVSRLLAEIPASPDESLTTVEPSVETAKPVQEEPAPPVSAEPPPAEAAADQWMSQFTETPAAPGDGAAAEPPPVPVEAAQAPQVEAVEDPFSGLSATEPEIMQPAETAPEMPIAVEETGEPFEQFVDRKRGELFGLENSMSLEDYLGSGNGTIQSLGEPSVEEPPAEDPFSTLDASQPQAAADEAPMDPFAALTQDSGAETFGQTSTPTESSEDPFAQLRQTSESAPAEEPKDQIEELAEKLKGAKKMTPVINLSDRTPVSPSESETPAGTGFVTPTLAEIYAKQGWYDDAIKAYKTLALNKPADKEKYEARILELENLKQQQENK